MDRHGHQQGWTDHDVLSLLLPRRRRYLRTLCGPAEPQRGGRTPRGFSAEQGLDEGEPPARARLPAHGLQTQGGARAHVAEVLRSETVHLQCADRRDLRLYGDGVCLRLLAVGHGFEGDTNFHGYRRSGVRLSDEDERAGLLLQSKPQLLLQRAGGQGTGLLRLLHEAFQALSEHQHGQGVPPPPDAAEGYGGRHLLLRPL